MKNMKEDLVFVSPVREDRHGEIIDKGSNEYVDFLMMGVVDTHWLGAAERSRGEIEKALVMDSISSKNQKVLIAGSTVLSVENSGPLIPEHGDLVEEDTSERDYALLSERLMHLDKFVLNCQFSCGSAVYDTGMKEGLMVERSFPITFSSFNSQDEVDNYLSRLARITKLEIDLMDTVKAQNYCMSPEQIEYQGRIARDSSFLADDEEFAEYYGSHLIELSNGLNFTNIYPGGIYLGALVATGKVKTIDGISVDQLTDYQLGKYISQARDADAWTIDQLLRMLGQEKLPLEVVYTHGDWTNVYMGGRRKVYPLHKFYLPERDKVADIPEDIWRDENLPPKVKRQLLLQRLGVEINPHLHVPMKIFFEEGEDILAELYDLWRLPVGMSSALYNEPLLGRTPSAQFSTDMTETEVAQELQSYKERLDELKSFLSPPHRLLLCIT